MKIAPSFVDICKLLCVKCLVDFFKVRYPVASFYNFSKTPSKVQLKVISFQKTHIFQNYFNKNINKIVAPVATYPEAFT